MIAMDDAPCDGFMSMDLGKVSPRRHLSKARIARQRRLVCSRLLVASMAALGAGGAPRSNLHAMDFHVHGHQITMSGDVTCADGYVLADLMVRLRAQGKTINTLVMRNSNGGSVLGGYDIADLARRNHLKAVASGYCISACSMMFVGGVERAFDGGPNKDIVGQQNIQIHGQSMDGKYENSDRTTDFYWHFVNAIAGGDITQTDATSLDKAFGSTTLALLWDPAYGKHTSVYWGKEGKTNYQTFPDDDVYSTRFITQHTPEMTTDAITITGQRLFGNINPNYYNKYDSNTKVIGLTHRLYDQIEGPLLTVDPPSGDLTKTSELVDLELAAYNALSPAERRVALTRICARSKVFESHNGRVP
jgi:hypothetical protein